MPYGYWGRVLEVDLGSGRAREVKVPKPVMRAYLGGRGLALQILWSRLGRVWEEVDPLSSENVLAVFTGPLTGYYPGVRVCVTGKSPLSNGVIGSTVASEVGLELKAAGYDGVLVTGASKDPVYLYVRDGEVEVRDASRYWGMVGSELLASLLKELRSDYSLRGAAPDPAVLYIGPAGENLVRTAAVMSKLTHAAGYGGYGAVMGSKRLKAIVVKGTGPLPNVKNPDEVNRLRGVVLRRLTEAGRGAFRYWGTAIESLSTGFWRSSEPVRNWREEWHSDYSFSHLTLEGRYWVKRSWSDYGCPTACMKVASTRCGGRLYVTDGPDYELCAYLGSNLDLFNVESAVKLSALVDELGLDGINTGNVVGLALELFERGVISEEDVGYRISWGDEASIARLIEDIAYRRGFGKVLAEGTYRAALSIGRAKGVDVLRYAVQVKGVAVGAHGVRSGADYTKDIAYAVSTQGGDHTSVASTDVFSQDSELWLAFLDSAVVCWFNGVEEAIMINFLNAVTGWHLTRDEWYHEVGARVLTLQRVLLLLGGPDVFWDPRIHDDNPPRFYEPLPSGPYKGKAVSRDSINKLKKEYFKALGWDELGIPTEETLTRLGLKDAISAVKRVRRRLGLE